MAIRLLAPALLLPSRLPNPEAIRSFGTGTEAYEVEFWEMQYRVRPFLGRTPKEYLQWRYACILRNLERLVSEQRDVIPIQSFLSSWYWFRKEYQTRLEFTLRNEPIPLPIINAYQAPIAPLRPKHPNAGDILFRYSKAQYAESLCDGRLRLETSQFYAKIENDEARRDVEHEKTSFLSGAHVRITTMDGKSIPVKGDVSQIVGGPHYYLLCLSAEWDPRLFEAFGADSCVLIEQPHEFRKQLLTACRSQLPRWYCELTSVDYFDPYDMLPNQVFHAVMSKDFSFAYQQEWRFVCIPPPGIEASIPITIDTAPLRDITKIYPSTWKPAVT